jgi:DNA end-binding protein Ku
MGKAGKAAIATFVMRGREYLAAVRAGGDILVLETLFFADEVRDPHQQIMDLPARVKLSRQELSMAHQLIDAMSGPWKPADYRDTYTDRVNDLIDAKKNDKEFQPAEEAPAATNVVDLADLGDPHVEVALPCQCLHESLPSECNRRLLPARTANQPQWGRKFRFPGATRGKRARP